MQDSTSHSNRVWNRVQGWLWSQGLCFFTWHHYSLCCVVDRVCGPSLVLALPRCVPGRIFSQGFLLPLQKKVKPRHCNLWIMLIPPLCITFCFLVDRRFICNILLLSSSQQWFSNTYMYIHSFSDISIKGYYNLSLQGAWVQSLVEKRSCMLHSLVKICK